MATVEREITCPMCGFNNPESAERCRSCGAKVEEVSSTYSSEEAYERRYQQDHFEWRWALLAAGVYLAAQPRLYRRGLIWMFPPSQHARVAEVVGEP